MTKSTHPLSAGTRVAFAVEHSGALDTGYAIVDGTERNGRSTVYITTGDDGRQRHLPRQAIVAEITPEFAKGLVDKIDHYLHYGARKFFKNDVAAATHFHTVWAGLTFAPGSVGAEWQESGLGVLTRIMDGELTGFDAQDHLHGCNGMFNQTHSDASEFSAGSPEPIAAMSM